MEFKIEKAEDVTIHNCLVRNCGRNGVWVRSSQGIELQKSRFLENGYGVGFHSSTKVRVDENEIGRNLVDGLILTWGTSDVDVQRNYIHHHLSWAHPDGIQVYRDVTDVRIVGNFILANGQSIHIQQADKIRLSENVIVGSNANSITFTRAPDATFECLQNTIAFTGLQIFNVDVKHFAMEQNVLMTGHKNVICSTADPPKVVSTAIFFGTPIAR